MLAAGAAIALIGSAVAYYGSSYSYHVHDDNNQWAVLTSSGTWSHWDPNRIVTVSARIDSNIVVQGNYFKCWRVSVTGPPPWGPSGMQRHGGFSPNLTYYNTPWYRIEYAADSTVGGDARWFAGMYSGGTSLCSNQYYEALMNYNTFIVSYYTNYNNQGDSGRY